VLVKLKNGIVEDQQHHAAAEVALRSMLLKRKIRHIPSLKLLIFLKNAQVI